MDILVSPAHELHALVCLGCTERALGCQVRERFHFVQMKREVRCIPDGCLHVDARLPIRALPPGLRCRTLERRSVLSQPELDEYLAPVGFICEVAGDLVGTLHMIFICAVQEDDSVGPDHSQLLGVLHANPDGMRVSAESLTFLCCSDVDDECICDPRDRSRDLHWPGPPLHGRPRCGSWKCGGRCPLCPPLCKQVTDYANDSPHVGVRDSTCTQSCHGPQCVPDRLGRRTCGLQMMFPLRALNVPLLDRVRGRVPRQEWWAVDADLCCESVEVIGVPALHRVEPEIEARCARVVHHDQATCGCGLNRLLKLCWCSRDARTKHCRRSVGFHVRDQDGMPLGGIVMLADDGVLHLLHRDGYGRECMWGRRRGIQGRRGSAVLALQWCWRGIGHVWCRRRRIQGRGGDELILQWRRRGTGCLWCRHRCVQGGRRSELTLQWRRRRIRYLWCRRRRRRIQQGDRGGELVPEEVESCASLG